MADSHREHDAPHSPEWDLLARYLAGESDPAERARVEHQLAEHPDRAALLKALDAACHTSDVEPLSPDAVETALAAVMTRRGTTVTPRHTRPRHFSMPMRAAAALLVIAGGTLVWRMATTGDASRDESTPARTFASAVGALDSLRLPDGTRVVLGPGSTLELPAGYGVSSRAVSLRGQALFDVVHDTTRPFVVTAGAAELRDVGTIFTVESDRDGGEVRVAVTEGAVAIQRGDLEEPGDTLRAGDRATVSSGGTMRVTRGAASADDLAWLERRLVLRDAPLARVAADLHRWYGLELRIADSTLATRHLTATFDRDTRADVGRLLAAALGASVTQSGDTIWLRPTAGSARR
jgi:transmembrane sensor